MNRKKTSVVVLGAVVLLLALAFPPWVAHHDDSGAMIDGRKTTFDRDLGRSWIGSPPGQVTSADLNFTWEPGVTAEVKKGSIAGEVSKYEVPAIDWRSQRSSVISIGVLTFLIASWLGRKQKGAALSELQRT